MVYRLSRLNLMILMCNMFQFAQAADHCNQDDTTSVIRCVIEIESKKAEIDKLWDIYFYNQSIEVSSVYVNGQYVKVYNSFPLRKPFTTDENADEYKKAKDEYNVCVEEAIENIKLMVSNGANLHAQDEFGKTAIDYCSIQEVYLALRDLGAPISLRTWFYFNENEAILISAAGIAIIAVGLGITAGAMRAIYQ